MAISTYTKSGSKASTAAKLNKDVFEVLPSSHALLHQAYTAYIANGRENLAKTLKRGEVRGGGKKPWKQKGTGRARFGSIRVPLWRGGGIIFGPLGKENYSKKISVNAKRTAIRQALSLKADQNAIIVIESIALKDNKTKDAAALLSKVGARGKTVIAVDTIDIATARAFSNLPRTEMVQARYLNVYNVINADTLLITEKALQEIDTWLGKTKEAK